MPQKKSYRAIWQHAGQPQTANVDFEAISDYHAKVRADSIAIDVNCCNTPRTLMSAGRVVESLTTGRTKPR